MKNATGYSATPDDDVFRDLAQAYIDGSPVIKRGKGNCITHRIAQYDKGLLNGGILKIAGLFNFHSESAMSSCKVFGLSGTLADHNYGLHHTYHIHAYISCCSFPQESTIESYFRDNRDALVNVLKFAQDCA